MSITSRAALLGMQKVSGVVALTLKKLYDDSCALSFKIKLLI